MILSLEKAKKQNKSSYLNLLKLKLEQKRREKIKLGRVSFWSFCQMQAPDFYLDNRRHLRKLCDTLQDFYHGKLINQKKGKPYKKLIIEMPPRHGKTRTLINFCSWILGQDTTFKIITAAYNEDLATEFSRYTRDAIQEEKNTEEQIIYSDMFPDTKLKHGDSSFRKWALEGYFFNFKSTGKGGGVTGRGGNMLLIDDPVKDAADAYNENQLKADWSWYTGTWVSRKEPGALEIINHTPWSKKDISGRIQSGKKKDDWYLFKLPAFDGKKMLCPEMLSLEEYRELEDIMDPIIFAANYKLERIDVKGLLYGDNWKTYTDFPRDQEGHDLTTEHVMWGDTADTGEDFLCTISGKLYNGLCYVTDIYYTKESVETTEPEIARRAAELQVNLIRLEANNRGHAIAMHIKDILTDKIKWYSTIVDCFTQSGNKKARILSNAKVVKDKILFPVDWKERWPDFYQAVTTYLKEGKNAHDDGPDTLTQIVEYIQGESSGHFFIKRNG